MIRRTAPLPIRAPAASLSAIALAGLLGWSAPAGAQVAVRAETLHTMAGAPMQDAVVIVRDGRIERIGPAATTSIPDGYRVLQARVVTPGLIDAHSVVGLAGYLNQPHDQDQVDTSAPIQPELRAIDGYNAREALVEWLRQHGVTTLHTGHAPAAIVSGQTMIVKTGADAVPDGVISSAAMVAATLGSAALGQQGRSPGTRSKAVAMLRAELVKAREYAAKRNGPEDRRPARDLRLETLARVLDKELPLLVTAHRSVDILAALRIAQEFDLRLVLDGAAEAYLLADQIKAAGVPVIVHPTMARAGGDTENLTMENAALLKRAGIPVALQSGYETYVPRTRVVLFEAAMAAERGLGFDGALAAITIDAARVLGIGERVGSIEAGKDGDLALFDGDPFEYTTKVVGVVIDGRVVSETPR
jgi:imidazolonepropionase-like amidohydrolase